MTKVINDKAIIDNSILKLTGSFCGVICLSVIFVSALLLHLKVEFVLSWDLVSYYLPHARDIVLQTYAIYPFGEIWSERITFELFLSLCYLLSDEPIRVATIMIGCVGAIYVFLGALLAIQVTGRVASLVPILLTLLSTNIIFWAPRHIDAFWPVFLFLALILFLLPKSTSIVEGFIGVASGVLVICALFAKEVTFLFLPVFGLLWLLGSISGGRERLYSYYATTLIGIVLWFLYFRASPVSQSAGDIVPATNVIDFTLFAFSGLYKYYSFSSDAVLNGYFALAPLLTMSGLYCCISSLFQLRRREIAIPEKILAVCLLVFLPFDAVIGINDFRVSQNLFSIMVLHLSLGLMVTKLSTLLLARLWPTRKWLLVPVVGAFTLTALVYQLHFDKISFKNSYQKTAFNFSRYSEAAYKVRGAELYEWFQTNQRAGANIVIDYKPVRAGIDLISEDNYKVFSLPLKGVGYSRLLSNMGFEELATSDVVSGPSLLLSPQRSIGSFRSKDWLALLPYDNFFNFLHDKSISHIVLPKRTVFNYESLHHFLSNTNGVKVSDIVRDSRVEYVIYAVDLDEIGLSVDSSLVYTSLPTLDFIAYLERENGVLWSKYREIFIAKIAAFKEENGLISSQLKVAILSEE